ncbi:hypothetical protein BTO06_06870 [Tenacibaculum sp. SZ-18]|uniref:SPOR domain-containing protein n=1 Tax=Tenacibaculum sp. SZ-18 TaxID=754423 RepID=UPI000C2D0DE9|nr:SPOR domain-containing protein [Tenacibaculum sp. SZ-18]AUC14875.1 hypothetical protein BTO06_06870 [Tenacibaculum sp. SZ-18]
MPFLNDQEYEDLQEQIKILNSKNEDLETQLSEKEEELGDVKSTARNRNILLSFLSGVSIAAAVYFSQNQSGSNLEVSEIKRAEATRILDSIADVTADSDYNDDLDVDANEGNSSESEISKIKTNIENEIVYSVQIGAFTNKKYPLLSKTIAGTLSNEEYLRYSIGLFSTLKEAQNFRRQLLRLGFDDAFVASYINGERQEIHKPY